MAHIKTEHSKSRTARDADMDSAGCGQMWLELPDEQLRQILDNVLSSHVVRAGTRSARVRYGSRHTRAYLMAIKQLRLVCSRWNALLVSQEFGLVPHGFVETTKKLWCLRHVRPRVQVVEAFKVPTWVTLRMLQLHARRLWSDRWRSGLRYEQSTPFSPPLEAMMCFTTLAGDQLSIASESISRVTCSENFALIVREEMEISIYERASQRLILNCAFALHEIAAVGGVVDDVCCVHGDCFALVLRDQHILVLHPSSRSSQRFPFAWQNRIPSIAFSRRGDLMVIYNSADHSRNITWHVFRVVRDKGQLLIELADSGFSRARANSENFRSEISCFGFDEDEESSLFLVAFSFDNDRGILALTRSSANRLSFAEIDVDPPMLSKSWAWYMTPSYRRSHLLADCANLQELQAVPEFLGVMKNRFSCDAAFRSLKFIALDHATVLGVGLAFNQPSWVVRTLCPGDDLALKSELFYVSNEIAYIPSSSKEAEAGLEIAHFDFCDGEVWLVLAGGTYIRLSFEYRHEVAAWCENYRVFRRLFEHSSGEQLGCLSLEQIASRPHES